MTLKSSDILVDTAVIYGDYSGQTAAQFFHQAEAHTSAAAGMRCRVLHFPGNVEAVPSQVPQDRCPLHYPPVKCTYPGSLPVQGDKEFKLIKNMVIREAERIRLSEVTFEDEQMVDELDEEEEVLTPQTHWQMVNAYREAKYVLDDDDASWTKLEEAVQTLEQLWDAGLTVAAHQLGKCWRDGLGVLPDDDKAELWFRRSAEAGNDFSQYALGKLLQQQGRITEAVEWYEQASAQGNQYADYRLGKLYLQGEDVPKDTVKAISYLTQAAESGNQYAQYALGKLYLDRQDGEEA